MKVLVIGGAGFIGSHLAERLLVSGHDVVCFDNFDDFYDPELKKRNIGRAMESKRYKMVTGDILDRDRLDRLFEDEFDAVAHLASYEGERGSVDRPDVYQRVNVEGTLNVLERCRDYKVKRFVFASSSSVYGECNEVPFREVDAVMRPISPSAATKVAGEALCHAYHYLFGIDVHILRLFTVYGPRQRPDMAIHLFANNILKGTPVKMFGDGRSSRDYTFVSDVVDGVAASIEKCSGFEVINIGAARPTCLDDLVEVLGKRLGKTPTIENSGPHLGDVSITFASVDRAREILGYEPKVGLEEGIDAFCTWLEERNGIFEK